MEGKNERYSKLQCRTYYIYYFIVQSFSCQSAADKLTDITMYIQDFFLIFRKSSAILAVSRQSKKKTLSQTLHSYNSYSFIVRRYKSLGKISCQSVADKLSHDTMSVQYFRKKPKSRHIGGFRPIRIKFERCIIQYIFLLCVKIRNSKCKYFMSKCHGESNSYIYSCIYSISEDFRDFRLKFLCVKIKKLQGKHFMSKCHGGSNS